MVDKEEGYKGQKKIERAKKYVHEKRGYMVPTNGSPYDLRTTIHTLYAHLPSAQMCIREHTWVARLRRAEGVQEGRIAMEANVRLSKVSTEIWCSRAGCIRHFPPLLSSTVHDHPCGETSAREEMS